MNYTYIYGGDWDFTGNIKGVRAFRRGEDGKFVENGVWGDKGGQSIMTFVKGMLIAVNELGNGGNVISYAIKEDGTLEELYALEIGCPKLSYVVADPGQEYVYVSSMGNGSVNMIKVAEDGALTLSDSVRLTGHSVTPRQSSAKVHSVMISPDGKVLAAANLGADEVDLFLVDHINGKLQLLNIIPIDFGQSPRHMAFHPEGEYLYLLTETGNRLYVLLIRDKRAGILAAYNTLNMEESQKSSAADVVVSRDGNYVYITNRGQNNIAAWKVNRRSGLLEQVGFYPCGGEGPRGICLSPDETELLCANYDSGTITRLKREKDTGVIGEVLDTVSVPAAGCVRVV